jgi:hypothetical protein
VSGGPRNLPLLSPREAWISDGRQVLHFPPTLWDRWSQRLEITSGELLRELLAAHQFRAGLRSRHHSRPGCLGFPDSPWRKLGFRVQMTKEFSVITFIIEVFRPWESLLALTSAPPTVVLQ